jgi:hypothetical protein
MKDLKKICEEIKNISNSFPKKSFFINEKFSPLKTIGLNK